MNPELWFVGKSGKIVLSFVPATGFKGKFMMIQCTPDGGMERGTLFPPPIAMTRYIDRDSAGTLYLGDAHYGFAPKGTFQIKKWAFPRVK